MAKKRQIATQFGSSMVDSTLNPPEEKGRVLEKIAVLAEQAKKRMLSGVKVDPDSMLNQGSEKNSCSC